MHITNSLSLIKSTLYILIILLIAKLLTLPLYLFLPREGIDFVNRSDEEIYHHYPISKAFHLYIKKAPAPHLQKIESTLSNIKLLGLIADKTYGIVLIQDGSKKKILTTNESYKGYKLVKVLPHKAIFEKNNKLYEVVMKHTSLKGSIKSLNESLQNQETFSIPKKKILYYKAHFSKIWKKIGIQEIYQKDKKNLQGFKVTYVAPGSIFEQMGLQQGDIIVGANGKTFRNIRDVFKLYNTIDQFNFVTITIKRNNTTKELQYAIY